VPDDDPPPTLTVSQTPQREPVVNLDAVTTLIHSFASMMTAMEARITDQIKDNASASKERWARWEQEFREYRATTDRRISALEDSVNAHHIRVHEEELRIEARVKPIKGIAAWFWRNWRDLLIIAIGLMAFAAAFGEWFGRIVGTHAP
jgi:hypothetical protein